MSEFIHLLEDENEFKWFYDHWHIKPLETDQVIFIALSARNKYLTEKERKDNGLGRTEMYGKTVIRHDSYESLVEHIHRLECDTRGFLSRKGRTPIPSKCVILYMLINPSSTRQVIRQQQQLIFDYQDELASAALKGTPEAIDSAWHKLKKVFDRTISYYPSCIAEKWWLDTDVDIPKELLGDKYCQMHEYLLEKLGKGNFMFVDTHGGTHILSRKSVIKFNPKELCTELGKIIFPELPFNCVPAGMEIIMNDNMQIPTPGTLQGNHLVTILNKEDFE
jgi:hypothetical protein